MNRAGRPEAWAVQLYARDVLRTFVAACEKEQIDVLPVKGIITGRVLYEHVEERPISDVDVRIRYRDFPRLVRLAERLGWKVPWRSRAYRAVCVSFDGIEVDARAYVAPPGMCAITTDEMLDRATRTDALHGFSHLVPEFHDHALLLVTNVFKDKLVHAFEWAVRDVERVARHPRFEVARFVERARAARSVTLAWIVAEFLAEERGVGRWGEVRDALDAAMPRAGYASAIGWLRSIEPRASFALRVLSRGASDSPRERVRAWARMAWWQAEVWRSHLTKQPFNRNELVWLEPGRRPPSPPPEHHG